MQTQNTISNTPPWMRKEEYARYRGVSLRTLEGMMANGQCPFFKGGASRQAHVRINVQDADRALDRFYRSVPETAPQS